jgi:hypothetical protein
MSALPGVVSVMLGMWLVRLIANPRAALLAGLMLALLPTAVRYSQEVRMYSWLGVVVARRYHRTGVLGQAASQYACAGDLRATDGHRVLHPLFHCALCARPLGVPAGVASAAGATLEAHHSPGLVADNVAIVVLFVGSLAWSI